jgi:hypothetical protein
MKKYKVSTLSKKQSVVFLKLCFFCQKRVIGWSSLLSKLKNKNKFFLSLLVEKRTDVKNRHSKNKVWWSLSLSKKQSLIVPKNIFFGKDM